MCSRERVLRMTTNTGVQEDLEQSLEESSVSWESGSFIFVDLPRLNVTMVKTSPLPPWRKFVLVIIKIFSVTLVTRDQDPSQVTIVRWMTCSRMTLVMIKFPLPVHLTLFTPSARDTSRYQETNVREVWRPDTSLSREHVLLTSTIRGRLC